MLDSVKRGETKCLALGNFFGIRGVPLRDAGVEIPAVEVDTLALSGEISEQGTGGGEAEVFEVHEADDDVGYLNSGVIDVVLNADFVPRL